MIRIAVRGRKGLVHRPKIRMMMRRCRLRMPRIRLRSERHRMKALKRRSGGRRIRGRSRRRRRESAGNSSRRRLRSARGRCGRRQRGVRGDQDQRGIVGISDRHDDPVRQIVVESYGSTQRQDVGGAVSAIFIARIIDVVDDLFAGIQAREEHNVLVLHVFRLIGRKLAIGYAFGPFDVAHKAFDRRREIR